MADGEMVYEQTDGIGYVDAGGLAVGAALCSHAGSRSNVCSGNGPGRRVHHRHLLLVLEQGFWPRAPRQNSGSSSGIHGRSIRDRAAASGGMRGTHRLLRNRVLCDGLRRVSSWPERMVGSSSVPANCRRRDELLKARLNNDPPQQTTKWFMRAFLSPSGLSSKELAALRINAIIRIITIPDAKETINKKLPAG